MLLKTYCWTAEILSVGDLKHFFFHEKEEMLSDLDLRMPILLVYMIEVSWI